jgi:hypothetical protein
MNDTNTLCHAKLDVMIDARFQQFYKFYVDVSFFTLKITKWKRGNTDP